VRLLTGEPLIINGRGLRTGAGYGGALHSISGINVWTAGVQLGEDAGTEGIGVDVDSRPGHPTADNGYIANDYSLEMRGLISDLGGLASDSDLAKVGLGQLILPNANIYKGQTFIEQGWVTIKNDNALGVLRTFTGI